MKTILILAVFTFFIHAQNNKWGWSAHRFINENAVDYLPQEMNFFSTHKNYIKEHSVDPDIDNLPGYYHYIDIDYYPQFFTGYLPHEWDDFVALFGLNTVIDNGTIPWVIETWTDSLTSLMQAGNWNDVWQVAAELGHYLADSHQPLHLTLNYNGQLTGNYGIHSRYETTMLSSRFYQIVLPEGNAVHWDSPIDSVFQYIEEIYPYVDSIMIADDNASSMDPSYGSVYYDHLWLHTKDLTIKTLQKSILDLAALWYTAWINAGSPNPTFINTDKTHIPDNLNVTTYPNPFNPVLNIKIDINKHSPVTVAILNLNGQYVKKVYQGELSAGTHLLNWNSSNVTGTSVSSGFYILSVHTPAYKLHKKILLLK